MGFFVANKMIKMLINAGKQIKGSRVLILGLTFKENCPDIRNTKVVDVYYELQDFDIKVDIYDYEANPNEVKEEYGIHLIDNISNSYDGIILAVSHRDFENIDLEKLKKDKSTVIYDLKGFLPREFVNLRL